MHKRAIHCDHCESDLTYSKEEKYRIEVTQKRLPRPPEGRATDWPKGISIGRLPSDLHFCGLKCLAEYAKLNL